MSEAEDHARLFAFTVPGNISASTLGSNGAGRSDDRGSNIIAEARDGPDESPTPREVRDERRIRTTLASEIRHDRNPRRDSTGVSSPRPTNPDEGDFDEDEQRNPEDECIEYMDDIVENFRRNEVTKLKALTQIISILDFNPSRTEEAKDAAVEYYSKTLNEVEALASSATKRGEHAAIGLRSKSNDIRRIPTDVDQDNAIDELISQISRESNKLKRDLSPGRTDPDDDPSEPSNKKR